MIPLVLGLDLSITATGICRTDGTTRTIGGPARLGDNRLGIILGCVTDELEQPVDLAVIEDLPTHAHGAGITGMVHGLIRWELIHRQIPYALVVPSTLKKYATGKGTASKSQMGGAAGARAGIEFADDNQCDAWWLRAMALDHLGHPVVTMPAVNRTALTKVTWPHLSKAA